MGQELSNPGMSEEVWRNLHIFIGGLSIKYAGKIKQSEIYFLTLKKEKNDKRRRFNNIQVVKIQ